MSKEVHLDAAVSTLRNGGVIAYPTEAVWGLGCNPFNENAVNKIKEMKMRSDTKGLILVASQVSQLGKLFTSLPKDQQLRIAQKGERPTTWLIEDAYDCIPSYIKGPFSSVAVRISSHSDIVSLCSRYDSMIISTSANTSGAPAALTEQDVFDYFASDVDYYLPGSTGRHKRPSQIIELKSGVVIRS